MKRLGARTASGPDREVFSPSTRRRDQNQKRDFYSEARIPEYWMADPERGSITVTRLGQAPLTVFETIVWQPRGVTEPLTIPLAAIFGPR